MCNNLKCRIKSLHQIVNMFLLAFAWLCKRNSLEYFFNATENIPMRPISIFKDIMVVCVGSLWRKVFVQLRTNLTNVSFNSGSIKRGSGTYKSSPFAKFTYVSLHLKHHNTPTPAVVFNQHILQLKHHVRPHCREGRGFRNFPRYIFQLWLTLSYKHQFFRQFSLRECKSQTPIETYFIVTRMG